MTITRPTAPGALLLAATLVLAACGGSAATPAPTAAPVTPAPTEAPATPAPQLNYPFTLLEIRENGEIPAVPPAAPSA